MKPKAYIETTIVSYVTAWPSRDVVIAGHQQITRQWWQSAADRFEPTIICTPDELMESDDENHNV